MVTLSHYRGEGLAQFYPPSPPPRAAPADEPEPRPPNYCDLSCPFHVRIIRRLASVMRGCVLRTSYRLPDQKPIRGLESGRGHHMVGFSAPKKLERACGRFFSEANDRISYVCPRRRTKTQDNSHTTVITVGVKRMFLQLRRAW